MTTQQRSASPLRPSRLCRYLACAVLLKLCLLGSMLVEPFWPGQETKSAFSGQTAQAPENHTGPVKQLAQAQNAPHSGRYLLSPSTAQAAQAAQADPQPAPPSGNDLSREALQRRQEEIARKEQDMRALEKDLDARLERLQLLESRLQMMLKEAEEVKSAKFRHLVDVLSNMKAKQAAEVLETLDEKIAVKVLSGMRGRQAGEILTFVKAPKAARLSESLARMQLPFE